MSTAAQLDSLSRQQLVDRARSLGVERPERMTRIELRDEILRRSLAPEQADDARGLFGIARSMIASVVEGGLQLPDAARVIRGKGTLEVPINSQTPVATVTLAEIYAAQGHQARAERMIEEVLSQEPGHQEALRVQEAFRGTDAATKTTDQIKIPETPLEATEAASADAAPSAPAPAPASSLALPLAAEDKGAAAVAPEPANLVETIGEEIQTGEPPAVDQGSAPADSPPAIVEPELVALQGPDELLLYFEMPTSELLRWQTEQQGELVVKVASVVPGGRAPQVTERIESLAQVMDREESRVSGSLTVHPLVAGATTRAALGWARGEAFAPLAVAHSLETCGADPRRRSLAERAAHAFAREPGSLPAA